MISLYDNWLGLAGREVGGGREEGRGKGEKGLG